jgi:endo-1,4-beta-D-glucanase Y
MKSMIDRRELLKAGLLGAGSVTAMAGLSFSQGSRAAPRASSGPFPLPAEDWRWFRETFVTPEGRVVDTGNGGISHSEGQGYGMLLADAAGSRDDFNRIWQWTHSKLVVRPDGLTAWKWVAEGGGKVADMNNATDGDILIAWALLRAGQRWNDRACLAAATSMAVAVRTNMIRRVADRSVLMPGREGFDRPDGLIANLSYWVFPALLAFHDWEKHQDWSDLVSGGLALLAHSRFSKWQLPADWVLVEPDLKIRIAEGFPARFGFDAIRVPLYLTWAGYNDAWYLEPYVSLVEAQKERPGLAATVDLTTGEPSAMGASPGAMAVYGLASRALKSGYRAPRTENKSSEDYYSASLRLLSKVAAQENGL